MSSTTTQIKTDESMWTFRDVIDHIMDASDSNAGPKDLRRARRAVLEGYRDFPNFATWTSYQARTRVKTVVSVSTGTCSYDHTGGASERLLTFSSAVALAEHKFFRILIDGEHYPIDTFESSTTLTLPQSNNPGADIAATTYELYRSEYPVPDDFRKGNHLLQINQSTWVPVYVEPEIALETLVAKDDPQDLVYHYTIRGANQHYDGGLVFEFYPPPNTARSYDFTYDRNPRRLRTWHRGNKGGSSEYSEGTITVSGTTVTGVETVFTEDMVGSILRTPHADSVGKPTGLNGRDELDNPYAEQRRIVTFTSSTSVEISAAFDGTYTSATQYTIGDPIDVENEAMLTAFVLLCEWKFARLRQDEKPETYQRAFYSALNRASAADARFKPMEAAPARLFSSLGGRYIAELESGN